MKARNDDLIVAVDIGSSKIVTAISEVEDSGNIAVIGLGKSKTNEGVRNGVVVNINSVVESITEAITDAEMQAGREIKNVFVAVSGKDVKSINSKGVVAIAGADKEIRGMDVDRVIEAAKAVAIPMDRDILHIIPQSYTVDGQDNIKYPVGMFGTRLEAQIHIITTTVSSIQNVNKCFERVGVGINSIVIQNIAAERAVLTNDEKELGVLLLDIGAETTKVSIYHKQAPIYTAIYHRMGGYLITNDLSVGLSTSLSNAENLKLEFGVADYLYVDDMETIQIPVVGGRLPKSCPKRVMVDIIKPRILEMFHTIKGELAEKGLLDLISGGIVITGGTSCLPGIDSVCQEVFEAPARIGYVKKLGGLGDHISSPEYAVVNGLILLGYEKMLSSDNLGEVKGKKGEGKKGLLDKVSDVIKLFF